MILKTKAFTIFNEVIKDPIVESFLKVLENENSEIEKVESYSKFLNKLYEANENLTEYLWDLVSLNENIVIRKLSKGEKLSDNLRNCVNYELEVLEELGKIPSHIIKNTIDYNGFLGDYEVNNTLNFKELYKLRMENIFSLGYGIYTKNSMFTYSKEEIVPVKNHDKTTLKTLTGYPIQREEIVNNTLAFIKGSPAANTLLYGDAGTGKSSTVKALVNEFSPRGLRMIEVRKGDILQIPDLMEKLNDNPLKFIIFIDDLSFSKNNEEVGALKAILEGSVSCKASNVIIYATSNRRHIVQETFSQRGNDEININETIQEQTSLSDRFGLSILFGKPNKFEYLDIVYNLLKEYNLKDIENIDVLAERHAQRRGGRSGRVAKQFVESLASKEI